LYIYNYIKIIIWKTVIYVNPSPTHNYLQIIIKKYRKDNKSMSTLLPRESTRESTPTSPREMAKVGGLHFVGVLVLLAGAFLPIADFFIVNVALPTINRSLHASGATLELIVAGYGTAYAATLVLGGRLGDRYGRHRLFLVGLIAFLLASLACGLSPTIWF